VTTVSVPLLRPVEAADVEHFRALGFVVLRAAIDAATLAALQAEADEAIRDATGPRYLVRREGGGIEGHYIPATDERTPVSLALACAFAAVAESFLGNSLLLSQATHVVLFDMATWHTDTGHAVPSVKVVAYLDPLDAGTGALRVLPGSHNVPYEHLASFFHGGRFRDEGGWREAVAAAPGHVVATMPGDVIVFDEHLWHASANGRNRRQWAAAYVADPTTEEDEAAVGRYLASQFGVGGQLDYDPDRFPYYGAHFRRVAPPRWVEQLGRLGAFDAAAEEERTGTRPC